MMLVPKPCVEGMAFFFFFFFGDGGWLRGWVVYLFVIVVSVHIHVHVLVASSRLVPSTVPDDARDDDRVLPGYGMVWEGCMGRRRGRCCLPAPLRLRAN